jgi:hypothetical protein
MKLTDEAKAIILAETGDTVAEYWGAHWALTNNELLAAQGLIYKNGKENIKSSGHVRFTHNARIVLDELEEKRVEVATLKQALSIVKGLLEAEEMHNATLTQQVADYREALTYIAEVCSFGPPSAAKSECYKAARAVLDKYPTQLSKAKPR